LIYGILKLQEKIKKGQSPKSFQDLRIIETTPRQLEKVEA